MTNTEVCGGVNAFGSAKMRLGEHINAFWNENKSDRRLRLNMHSVSDIVCLGVRKHRTRKCTLRYFVFRLLLSLSACLIANKSRKLRSKNGRSSLFFLEFIICSFQKKNRLLQTRFKLYCAEFDTDRSSSLPPLSESSTLLFLEGAGLGLGNSMF